MAEEKQRLYHGKIVDLYLESIILPNGQPMDLEVVRHPGGAAVVALDNDGKLCLLRQFRHVTGGWIWELPAGKLDPGEPPLATAKRELQEEAGLEAADWKFLGEHVSSPGVFTEVIHLYLARDLSPVATETEPHEVIEVHWLPFAEALDWACNGRITDAKTLIGLFRAHQCRRQVTSPSERP